MARALPSEVIPETRIMKDGNGFRVTLHDVARQLEVSTTTVSLALRNDPKISLRRRQQIQEVANRMGYQRNPMAMSLVYCRRDFQAHPITAELAWINNWKDPARLRSYKEFDLYWRGAAKAAEQQGFRLQEFIVGGQLSFARLEKILRSRNIQGLLIPPHGASALTAPDTSSLDWHHYSVVKFGYSVGSLSAHVVAGNHSKATMLAFSQILKKGYERVGYMCHLCPSTRSKAGFLMSQGILPPEQRLPILELDLRLEDTIQRLQQWIEKHKPDAILTEIAETSVMLRKLGYRVPRDIGLSATSVLDGNADAGIVQNSEEIGKTAVETLVSLIYHNQTGFPEPCREVLVDSSWQDGSTLPSRC
jgi:DNA-binding LacI/PurR family transcriptional regulator